MKRIFTWSGRVCLAIDKTDAVRLWQLEAFSKPAVYDLTDPLLALANAHPTPAMAGGAGMDELQRLRSENDMLKAGYDLSVDARRRLEAELQQAGSQQDVIAREIIEALKTNDSLKAECDRLNAELVRLQAECDHLGETRAFMAQEMPPCAHEAELEALRKENGQLKELVSLHESDASFEAAAEAMAEDITALEKRRAEKDAARREAINPKAGGSKYPAEVDAAIRRKFENHTGWPDLVVEVEGLGHSFSKRQLVDRATYLGLRAGDFKKPAPAPVVPASPPDEPRILPVPVAPRPSLSPLADRYGDEVIALTDEFLNPDEIAKTLNERLPANDRLNAAQVRKIQVEMRAHQRGAA